RIESQKHALKPELLEVGEVFEQVMALCRQQAQKREVSLEYHISQGLTQLWADRNALEHILTNLVDNAVKYGGQGALVRLRAAEQSGKVRISVQDNGPGISKVHLPRLFERFYRVDTGRSRDVGGTGLGLSIVKHLTESMGGNVAVESEPGKGTTFSVLLPVLEPGQQPLVHAASAAVVAP